MEQWMLARQRRSGGNVFRRLRAALFNRSVSVLVFFQEGCRVPYFHGLRNVVALNVIAAESLQYIELFGRFDASATTVMPSR